MTRTANLVDEYKLHETLGSSAAFQVRRATRRASGEQCAIKLLHLSDALVTPRGDPAVELLSEIEILRALQGAPGVVSLLDHLRQAEPPVMAAVFELLMGGDLFDRIERQGPCTEPEAAQIAQQVGGALAHMHSLRIVHRDIKPDNLAFASRGDAIEVKLIDFGFATICPQDKLRGLSGTMDYAAPELVSWYAESQEEGAQSPLGVGAVEGTPYDEVSQSSPPPTLPPSPSAMPPSRPHLSPLTPQPHLLHTLCTHLPPASGWTHGGVYSDRVECVDCVDDSRRAPPCSWRPPDPFLPSSSSSQKGGCPPRTAAPHTRSCNAPASSAAPSRGGGGTAPPCPSSPNRGSP